MSERDFQIGDKKFKLNKIDVFKQFHIARKLGPILGDIMPVAQKISALQSKNKSSGVDDEQTFNDIAQLATPILDRLAKLSEADSNYILLGLCSAVEIQQMPLGNWARVATSEVLMFQDLELPALLQIAGRALQFNLAGFFALKPQTSHGGA